MKWSFAYVLCAAALAGGCQRKPSGPPAATTPPVRQSQPSAAPALQAVDARNGIYLARLEIHTTITPAGWLQSVRTENKSYGPNDKTRPRLEIREGQLTPAQVAELSRLFVGWESLRESYDGVADGPEIDILYGNHRVRSGGGPDQVSAVSERISQLAESMPRVRNDEWPK